MKYNKRKLRQIEFSVFISLRKLCVFASLREISCQKTTEFDSSGTYEGRNLLAHLS